MPCNRTKVFVCFRLVHLGLRTESVAGKMHTRYHNRRHGAPTCLCCTCLGIPCDNMSERGENEMEESRNFRSSCRLFCVMKFFDRTNKKGDCGCLIVLQNKYDEENRRLSFVTQVSKEMISD